MRSTVEQPVFFPDLQVENETRPIQFGQSVSLGSFWVSSVIDGNPYILSPIRASAALGFLHDPTKPPTRRKFAEISIPQSRSFNDSDFSDPQAKGIDLPPQLYEWLSSTASAVTPSPELQDYSSLAQKYFDKVYSIGPKLPISNSPFFLQIGSNVGSSHVEGEQNSKVLYLTGSFGEVRKGQEKDTIVRIRQNKGTPSEYDAIKLTLDAIAYMAATKKRGLRARIPILTVFNLTDGESYLLKAFTFRSLARNVINAINFSDLAARAGYLKVDGEGSLIINPDFINRQTKKVYIRSKKSKQKISAEEAFLKAENSLKRIRGQLPYTEKVFAFRKAA